MNRNGMNKNGMNRKRERGIINKNRKMEREKDRKIER
jgi:hypothetical protein